MSILNYFPAGGALRKGLPEFTYTGNYSVVDDGDKNWRLKFLSSGDFTLLSSSRNIQLFLVGGGAGGAGLNGGGGGYTKTSLVSITKDTVYPIVVGAGGAAGVDGNASSAFSISVDGGKTAGDGGSSGGARYLSGASNGGNGAGYGQGLTTREFGETTGDLYSGGGGGTNQGSGSGLNTNGGDGGGGKGAGDDPAAYPATNGEANKGGGGGAAYSPGTAAAGGSGLAVIRNVRS